VVLGEPLPQRLREGNLGGVYRTEPSPGTMRFSENEGIPLCDKNAKLTVWLDSDGVVRAKRLKDAPFLRDHRDEIEQFLATETSEPRQDLFTMAGSA
jgi:hypothetical protein